MVTLCTTRFSTKSCPFYKQLLSFQYDSHWRHQLYILLYNIHQKHNIPCEVRTKYLCKLKIKFSLQMLCLSSFVMDLGRYLDRAQCSATTRSKICQWWIYLRRTEGHISDKTGLIGRGQQRKQRIYCNKFLLL